MMRQILKVRGVGQKPAFFIRLLLNPDCRGELRRRFGARILMYVYVHSGPARLDSGISLAAAGFARA